MGNEEFGEHSRKNDNSDNQERPLKKARYVWQLKGKYHLKKHYKTNKNNTSQGEEGPSKSLNKQDNTFDNQNVNNSINNNDESRNNNNICKNRCCIDSFLIHTNAIMENDDIEKEIPSNNIDRSLSDEIPISLVQLPKNKDDLLYKWQARQVAKSFVDNTINTILEHCKLAPFDAADIIENCENGEQVEDEGILMAIQSHGLQSNSVNGLFSSTSNYQRNVADVSSKFPATNGENPVTQNSFKKQHIDESTFDNFENTQNEIVNQNISYENPERMSCDSCSEKVNEKNSQMEMEDPMDFLNAAVSVAIQKKGLSSYNYG